MDRYAVIGNPIAHSLSPEIHARFGVQQRDLVEYRALLAPLDAFRATALAFFDSGALGANVTLPFKVEAFELADHASDRARAAGAANVLSMRDGRIEADNTDGAGLVVDLAHNLGYRLRGARILLLGAGGAARGVIAPLLEAGAARITVANRNGARARELARRFTPSNVAGCALGDAASESHDLVLNATSASTHGEPLALPPGVLESASLAYDMAYGAAAGSFLAAARAAGAQASDGLGMLVEQAAESFLLWRRKRPDTAPVLEALRARFA